MALETQKTKIELDGDWSLEELSEATKDYVQLYGFAYSLLPELPSARLAAVQHIYGKFPWRGGYSTVNFFSQLFHEIPMTLRPRVRRIRYASPGFIELQEILIVAASVAAIVKSICTSIDMAHETYRKIQKASADHKLTKIDLTNKELDVTEKQFAFCERQSKDLIRLFGLSEEQERSIDQKAQGNPVMKLKILLSVYRRVEPLAKRQVEGKMIISGEESDGI